MIFHFLLFLASGVHLFIAANQIVKGIVFIARYLQWQEFVIAFFVMAIASSVPNLFVGISSALHGIPELSFGDVMGNSVIDLTLVAAITGIVGRHMSALSSTVQASSLIAVAVAVLPLLLITDGSLGRGDGVALLLIFLFYSVWLFSKRKTHRETFNHHTSEEPVRSFRRFFVMIGQIAGGVFLMLLSAEGVVRAAKYFATSLELAVPLVGILVIGMGSALPELYFGVTAARRGRYKVVLGELMGSVIVISTFVLGVVALIRPIVISDFSPFAIARVFLVLSAAFFFLFVKTDRKVTKGESFVLVLIYLAFLVAEIFHHTLVRYLTG